MTNTANEKNKSKGKKIKYKLHKIPFKANITLQQINFINNKFVSLLLIK